jgi:hypothetical protein
MLEPDDTSLIPRARAHYGNDRWREVRGPPAVHVVEADLANGQRRAFLRLFEILDEPLIGQVHHDFLLRRAQIEAARVMLALRPPSAPTTFPMPRLESVADAVSAQAAVLAAVADGKLLPLEGAEISRAVEGWLRALKASKSRPFNKREPRSDPG